MFNNIGAYLSGLATAAIILILLMLFDHITPMYKNGQVDAINGEINYTLKVADDGTSSWVYTER